LEPNTRLWAKELKRGGRSTNPLKKIQALSQACRGRKKKTEGRDRKEAKERKVSNRLEKSWRKKKKISSGRKEQARDLFRQSTRRKRINPKGSRRNLVPGKGLRGRMQRGTSQGETTVLGGTLGAGSTSCDKLQIGSGGRPRPSSRKNRRGRGREGPFVSEIGLIRPVRAMEKERRGGEKYEIYLP